MRGSYEKRGANSYRLVVRESGEKLTKTIKVKSTDEEKQKKEAERALALFIDEIDKGNHVKQNNMTLEEFSAYWFDNYANHALQEKTKYEYKRLLELRIIPALGHIKIQQLKPKHFVEFYSMLSQNDIRIDKRYIANSEMFMALLSKSNLNGKRLLELAEISYDVFNKLKTSQSINAVSAAKVCKALNITIDSLFKEVESDRKLSNRSIMGYHRLLSSMLNSAVLWELIPYNPCEKVKPPQEKDIDNAIENFYDLDQIEAFREALQNEPFIYKVMTELLLSSGLRLGELVGIEWSELDLENQILYVKQASQYVPSAGTFIKEKLKNKTSRREVHLPDYIVDLLYEWKAYQEKEKSLWGDKWENSNLLFTSKNGGKMFTYTLTHWMNDFRKKYNLDRITPHGMRHTYATLLVENGEDIKNIQDNLGHAKASTTTDFYLHASRKAKRKSASKLDKLLGKKIIIENSKETV